MRFKLLVFASASLLFMGLSGCAALSSKKVEAASTAASTPAEPASAVAVSASASQASTAVPAAEALLAEGLKLYQVGQYKPSEAQLKAALQAGLKSPADAANANKHLAFIYCMSKRETLCASAFKAAKAADASFALSKTEAGHPMWGKVYKKALGLK